MIFLSRRKRGQDPHLEWKIRLFFVGALLALFGMILDRSWLIGAAVAVLAAALLLRILPKKKDDA